MITGKAQHPAAAQRKAEKRREIGKSKRQHQTQRDEKLARKNTDRLEQQVSKLQGLKERGDLRPVDRERLTRLEKELRAINRAKGDAEPQVKQNLGKRRRDEEDEDVLAIPMPRDTPPPFPDHALDEARTSHDLPPKPEGPVAKTVYSAAPQLRDLQREAVQFVPGVVARQRKRIKGEGRLLEPEELDELEQKGYVPDISMKEVEGEKEDDDNEAKRLEAELEKLQQTVQMEEVEDEGD